MDNLVLEKLHGVKNDIYNDDDKCIMIKMHYSYMMKNFLDMPFYFFVSFD